MQKLRQRWSKASLNHKVAIIAIAGISIPSVIFIPIFFGTMRSSTLNNELQSMEYKVNTQSRQISTNVETLKIVERFFLGDTDLEDFLITAAERPITAQESINFYTDTLTTLERMVNSNPTLYQVRLYIPHQNVQEMRPLLYHEGRMNQLHWAREQGWNFSYIDNLFTTSVTKELIMAHVSKIYNDTPKS